MSNGFHNRILRVDLTTGQISTDEPGDRFYRTYFGGWGMIAHYLLKEVPPGTDPLGPENVLIFAPGVLTGAPAGGTGRHAVGAKSPLTGGFGEADVGGFWGAELKRAGWDGIIVTGQAEEPVYLWIQDDRVEIRDATNLWGKETLEVERTLRKDLGDNRIRVAQCGVAGENLVRYACVIHDVNRAAGRTGLGAVMGSKKLKAIAVRGSNQVKMADRTSVRQTMKQMQEYCEQRMGDFTENGTSGATLYKSDQGTLPTRNFQESTFAGAEKITGEIITETALTGRDSCYSCPVRCKRKVKSKGRYEVDPAYGGPEYETVAALGSCCGVDDLEAVLYGNQLCNAYGLDTISAGVTIAWAMECFERGLLTSDDTGGLELRFGNAEAMVAAIEQIARREGFGDTLAEGSLRAAQALGRDTEQYAIQVKGQEVALHDPRTKFAHGVGIATSPTGADHMHNIHDSTYASERAIPHFEILGILEPLAINYLGPEKMRVAAYHIDFQVFHNCLGMCMFIPYSFAQMRDVVRGVTGWNTSLFDMIKAGERALALARAFNYLHGLSPEDDNLPSRFFTHLESELADSGAIPADEFSRALELYYAIRGWDKQTGAPMPSKLHELGLGWVVDLLYEHAQ